MANNHVLSRACSEVGMSHLDCITTSWEMLSCVLGAIFNQPLPRNAKSRVWYGGWLDSVMLRLAATAGRLGSLRCQLGACSSMSAVSTMCCTCAGSRPKYRDKETKKKHQHRIK